MGWCRGGGSLADEIILNYAIFKEPGKADVMKVARMKWLGHAVWIDEEVILKQVLFCWITGSHEQGGFMCSSRIVWHTWKEFVFWTGEGKWRTEKWQRTVEEAKSYAGLSSLEWMMDEFFSVLCNFIYINLLKPTGYVMHQQV